MAGIGDRVKRLELKMDALEARARADDEGLRAVVDAPDGEECDNCGGPMKRVNGWVSEDCGDTSVGSAEAAKQEPAPVAVVGVKCPRCDPPGSGYISVWTKAAIKRGDPHPSKWAKCPVCLGTGLLHTHAEYQRVAQERDLYRRALIAACHDIGFGQADVDRFLAEAAQEASADE